MRNLVEESLQVNGRTPLVALHHGLTDVSDGLVIHNAMRRMKQRVTVDIDAMALSAGSVVAMGGDSVRMGASRSRRNLNPVKYSPWEKSCYGSIQRTTARPMPVHFPP